MTEMRILRAQIDKIVLLLAQGRTQRAIADMAGVSKSFVGSIARGERGLWAREVANPPTKPDRELGRCPNCGPTEMPCVKCEADSFKRTRRLLGDGEIPIPPGRDVAEYLPTPAEITEGKARERAKRELTWSREQRHSHLPVFDDETLEQVA